jgi:hypothetical protein
MSWTELLNTHFSELTGLITFIVVCICVVLFVRYW